MARAPLIVAALPQVGIFREILLGFRAIAATLAKVKAARDAEKAKLKPKV